MLAHADSGELQYTDAPPTVTGNNPPKSGGPSANKSASHNGAAQAPQGNSGSSNPHSSEGGHPGGGSPPGSGSGGGQNGGGENHGHGSKAGSKTSGGSKPASTKNSSGSSPLVPILIAILVLAAVSLGAVTIRQRRRRGSSGASVSPKAG